jgi:glucose/arabinose dehydrogenase
VPGTDRWIVVEVDGRIVSFSKTGERDVQLALNLREVKPRSGQVYGITFHPKFPQEPWCYIAYTAKPGDKQGTRVSRFQVTDPALPTIDPKSETVLIGWLATGHSGGSLHFGRDGYLYISVGDGQNPNPPDELNTGQDISDLEASVLRIDVNATSDEMPYRIPDDNPFVGQAGVRGEIWAYGFRNPWKMAFDPKTDTLWTGDVGWEMMEMVYRVDRGANYGWSVKEGSQIVKETDLRTISTPITPPNSRVDRRLFVRRLDDRQDLGSSSRWHADHLSERTRRHHAACDLLCPG